MKPSEYFKNLNIAVLDPMTQQFIREKIYSYQNIDLLDGTKEYEAIQGIISDSFPEAVGGKPKVEPEKIQKSDSKKEKREKLAAAASLKKQEADKIKQDKLRAKQDEKNSHNESVAAIKKQITELTELSELLSETEGIESKEALELIQETLPDLKKSLKAANKKKFLNGGDIDAKYDVKIWKSKEDFDKGESENFSTKVDLTNAITDAKTSMSMGSYAVEIYDSESGETYFDSTEDNINQLEVWGEENKLESKYVFKFHEERGEMSASVENMATNDTVWQFNYPDYSLDEDEREMQSTPVDDGFMKNWDDVDGLSAYLKDLTILPDGAELLSEDEAIQKHNYKDGGSIINQYEGKTDEQVWDEWSSDQRAHFMSDHNLDEFYTAHQVKYKFIDDRIKEQLKLHLLEGEYKTGGAIKNKERVETVLKHYLMAALWSSTDSENNDTPFDSDYDTDDFDADNVKKIRAHITKFLMYNEADLKNSGLDDEQIGHDLWLTQVGHGAGFWDRGLDKALGNRLSEAAQKLGISAYVYAQDGKVAIDGMSNIDEMAKGGGVGEYDKGVVLVKTKQAKNNDEVWDILNEKWSKYDIVNSRAVDLETPYNKGVIADGTLIDVKLLEKEGKYYWDWKAKYATGGGVGEPKISFQKKWHPTDGTVYDQSVKIDKRTYDQLRDAVASEIAMGKPQKNKYVSTSGYEMYLTPLKNENGISYLNHTQTRFINLFLKLPLKDRNTLLTVVDKYEEGGSLGKKIEWKYVDKYGSFYGIENGNLIQIPAGTDGSMGDEKEESVTVSKSAFNDEELIEFEKVIKDSTGWEFKKDYLIEGVPTKHKQGGGLDSVKDFFTKKLPIITDLPKGWILEDDSVNNFNNYSNGKYKIRVGNTQKFDASGDWEYFIKTKYEFEKNYSTDFLKSNFVTWINQGITGDIEYSGKTSTDKVNKKVLQIMNDVNDGKFTEIVKEREKEFYERMKFYELVEKSSLEKYNKPLSELSKDEAKSLIKEVKKTSGSEYNYEEGGALENNYEGKSESEVWNEWSEKQRVHFINDHKLHPRGMILSDYSEIEAHPEMKDFREALKKHVSEGQYKTGGNINEEKWEILPQLFKDFSAFSKSKGYTEKNYENEIFFDKAENEFEKKYPQHKKVMRSTLYQLNKKSGLIAHLKGEEYYAKGGGVGKTVFTKDGVEVEKATDKYKGHIFYDEKGGKYECLGYFPKLDDCKYLNLQTKKEVVGCMDGFYFNNPLEKLKLTDSKLPSNKALFTITVPNAKESLLSDDSEYDFISFISNKLTKKWFGNGAFDVRLEKKLTPKQSVFLITVPKGKESLLTDENEYDFTSFIGHELTKKWFGNGAFDVRLFKKLADGGAVATAPEIKKGTQILFTYEGKQHKGEVEEVREKGDYIVGYLDMVGQVLVKPEDIIEVLSYAKGGGVSGEPKYKKGDAVRYTPKLSGLDNNKKLIIDHVNYKDGSGFGDTKGYYYGFEGMNLSSHENDIEEYKKGGAVGDMVYNIFKDNETNTLEVGLTKQEVIKYANGISDSDKKITDFEEAKKVIKEAGEDVVLVEESGELYVAWSSWFDTNKYDVDKIKKALESIGATNIHTENEHGWANQPEVVVFTGDFKSAEKAVSEALGTEWISINDKDWAKGKYAMGGEVTTIDDSNISDKLRKKAEAKIKKKDTVVEFGYSDYGGGFYDKVAIKYFAENHPKNIVYAKSGYNGEQALVFGKVADKYLAERGDGGLGFGDMETMYFQMESQQEEKEFKNFLNGLKKDYTVKKDALTNLKEEKSGYYQMQANELDFNSEELTQYLLDEGYIEKKGADGKKVESRVDRKKMKQGGGVDNEEFEVATFDSDTDSAVVVEGGLSFSAAVNMAEEMWKSDKYYGVEVVRQDPNAEEPIQWIKTKSKVIESFGLADEDEMKQGGRVDNVFVAFYADNDEAAELFDDTDFGYKFERKENSFYFPIPTSMSGDELVDVLENQIKHDTDIVGDWDAKATKGGDDKQGDYLAKIEKETEAQKKKAESKGAKGYLNVINEILNYDNGSYLTEIKKFIPIKDGKMTWASIKTYKGYEIKFNKNGVDYFGVFDGHKLLSAKNTSIEDAKERIDGYAKNKPKRVNRKKKK